MAWSKLSRHERGYGTAWDKLRKQALTRDQYLCQYCKAKGRVTVATEVDHRTPKAKGGTDDLSNLVSTCSPCHAEKTITEKGDRVKRAIALDGWPVDD